MTARVVEQPHLFPGKALWGETVGPMIDLGNHSSFDANVYLTGTQLWEALRVGHSLLTEGQRTELIGLLGAASWAEVESLNEQVVSLTSELGREKINKVVPLADVVDFFEKRAALRPDEPVPVTQPKKAS